MAGEMTDYLKVTFWQGLEANLPSTKVGGRLYYATDTKTIYLDNNNQRYQFKCADPVTSVNGKTGSVNLDYSDVNALSNSTTYAGSASVGGPATYTNGIHYGTVDSTSTSTAFTATVNGITSLYDGVTVMLKNGVVTSASGFTININNLGAKPVYTNLAAATRDTTIFNINYTMLFVYDSTRVSGGCWICYRGYDTNTTYTLSNALSSHKFTSTLTAGGSGSGTSTATIELVAGTGIALTDDTSNKKITISSTVVDNDTKLKVAEIASNVTYYPIVGTGPEAATRQYDTKGFVYKGISGTTSVVGSSILTLGNSTASGTANNRQGQLVIYGSTAYAHTIQGAPTAARTITLPDATGTVALTSNIPTKTSDLTNDSGYITSYTDTKNTAGSTDTSSKIFLIGATSQAANPQTYSHDTAYVGTDGKLYSASKVVLVGGSNASSSVTITPTTTDVYSMTSSGSVTPGTAASYTQGIFSKGTLPTMTWAMDVTDTKQLNITFSQGTLPSHASDTFTANTPTAVTLPGRSSSAIKAWTGYSSATAAAQVFTGTTG